MDVDILLRALSRRGEKMDVITYGGGRPRQYPNVRFHVAGTPRWFGEVPPGFSLKKVLLDVAMMFVAARLIRDNRYDVIHADEEAVFLAMLFKWLYRIPYVYDIDSSIAQQMVEKMPILRPLAWFFNWCEGRAVRGSLAAAPVCNALAALARAHGARRVVTLHDISQLRDPYRAPTGELRRQLGIDGTILMYVGNLEAYQGVDLLIEAMPIVRRQEAPVDLVIAGGTAAHIDKYRRKAERLGVGDCVHFLGSWPADRLDDLLAEADILTAPRIKGVNTPMKVFPYMHSGRPVVVTDLPTHNHLLDNSVVMLAPPDAQGFAECLVKLAKDAGYQRRLGEAGRRFVEQNHTFDAHQKRVDRLYDWVGAACRPKRKAPL